MNSGRLSLVTRRCFVIICLLLAPNSSEGQGETLSSANARFAPTAESPWRASCATATCHGGIEGRGPAWNHALSTWMVRDPHAGAGRLLRDEDSRKIVERLDARAAGDRTAYDNVLRTRCIGCHTSATPEDCQATGTQATGTQATGTQATGTQATGTLDERLLTQGVHCESCHGSAEKWLEPHLSIDWDGSKRFDPAMGMRDTESIAGRAATCVRCHVGSRTEDGIIRDMNHDLIAAGHPALRFDLLIYNDNLPKHWAADSEVEQRFTESAVRVRQVGRAVNAMAAATLASERARDHLQDRSAAPWPELSDYDCFACHQSLSINEYLLPPRGNGQMKSPLHVSDGLPVWNSWHTVNNELEIRGNRRALETLSPHRSDPAQIAQLAQQIADRFREKVSQRSVPSLTESQRTELAIQSVERVRGQLQQSAPVDWHQAAIQYLELEAAARDLSSSSQQGAKGRQLLEALADVEMLLRFDSPRSQKRADDSIRRFSLHPTSFVSGCWKSCQRGEPVRSRVHRHNLIRM